MKYKIRKIYSNYYLCDTHLEATGVKKPREILRLRSDSVDGVCFNSPGFGVEVQFEFVGFT